MVVANGQLSEDSEKAIAVYEAEIESQLSEDDDGRFIVIDAETGEWDIGDTQDLILDYWDRTHSRNLVMLQHPNIFAKLWSRQLDSI